MGPQRLSPTICKSSTIWARVDKIDLSQQQKKTAKKVKVRQKRSEAADFRKINKGCFFEKFIILIPNAIRAGRLWKQSVYRKLGLVCA